MRKKYTSILIVCVIATAAFVVFASWAKLTHKRYAALTIGMFLEIGVIVIAIIWLFIEQKRRKINL
jgi:hypothetical protein